MEHATAEELNYPERYVAGKLSPDEAAAFEEHYLGCPACIAMVEDSERLLVGLQGLAVHKLGQGQEPASSETAAARSRFSPAIRLAFAAAALLLLSVPVLLQVFRINELNQRLEESLQPQADVPLYPLSPFRSAGGETGPVNMITLPRTPGWITLWIEPGTPEYETFQVSLIDARGRVSWQEAGLAVNSINGLAVLLHSSRLESGEFRLRLEGLAAGRDPVVLARYPLRVQSGQ